MIAWTMHGLFVGWLSASWAADVPETKPTDLKRGQELYERHCQQCHGETNRGDGPAAAALVHTVPDLVGKLDITKKISGTKPKFTVPKGLVNKVLQGTGAMPAYAPSLPYHEAKRALIFMSEAHLPPHERGAGSKKPDPAPEAEDSDSPADSEKPASRSPTDGPAKPTTKSP